MMHIASSINVDSIVRTASAVFVAFFGQFRSLEKGRILYGLAKNI